MAFSSKIETVIGDKIPVPQSWREVQQVNDVSNYITTHKFLHKVCVDRFDNMLQ